jgi:hypothetical protein
LFPWLHTYDTVCGRDPQQRFPPWGHECIFIVAHSTVGIRFQRLKRESKGIRRETKEGKMKSQEIQRKSKDQGNRKEIEGNQKEMKGSQNQK